LGRSAAGIEVDRATKARIERDFRDHVRNIGPPPDIVSPDARAHGADDLAWFLKHYFPTTFAYEWGEDHMMLIRTTEKVLRGVGGKYAVAMPRGSGKTTIFQHALIWAVLNAHRRFPILLCSDATNFTRLIEGIRTIIETNELLYQDYPEICHPVRKLDRAPTRAMYQICENESTYIQWGANKLVFPTTRWSIERGNAGCSIGGGGLSGSAIRGQVRSLPDGTQLRPDACLIDDPMTRAAAKSETQNSDREATIKADVLGMAGPGKDLALLISMTVIYPDDLAERLLDRQRHPQIQSLRVATIKKWPDNMDLWGKYADVRRRELLSELPPNSARGFYVANRKELDAGCVHYWPDRIQSGFESAIEASLAEYFDDPRSFMSERQNSPSDGWESEFQPLRSGEISKRTGPHKKGRVPLDAEVVTAFVDVQLRALFWLVAAWTKSGRGYVIDYGVTPPQPRRHFDYSELKNTTLQHKYPDGGNEDAVRAGLIDTLTKLSEMQWVRDDGTRMSLDLGLVDCRYMSHIIEAAVIQSRVKNWIPAFGVGVGAKDTPLKLRANNQGVAGEYWVFQKPVERQLRSMFVDTNHWKSVIYKSLSVPTSHSQAILLYEEVPSHHQMLADHCCSEVATRVDAKGRKIDEWDLRNKKDNHFWDCLVGAAVASSVRGVTRDTIVATPQRRTGLRKLGSIKL
jgi:hypothetical protein